MATTLTQQPDSSLIVLRKSRSDELLGSLDENASSETMIKQLEAMKPLPHEEEGESTRLIPEPRQNETVKVYLARHQHFAVVRSPAMEVDLVKLVGEVEGLRKDQKKSNNRRVRMGAVALQVAAHRKLKKAAGKVGVFGADEVQNDHQFAAIKGFEFVGNMRPQDLVKYSEEQLRESDLSKLCNRKWVGKRNSDAHEPWSSIAELLLLEEFENLRLSLQRIFQFVTGKTIEEAALEDEEDDMTLD